MYCLQNHISKKKLWFLVQVFVFSRISRQDETKHNKPQRQYFVCFSRPPLPRWNICGISSFTFLTTMLSLPLWKTAANILHRIFWRPRQDPTSTDEDNYYQHHKCAPYLTLTGGQLNS